jgi:hypothetical protein
MVQRFGEKCQKEETLIMTLFADRKKILQDELEQAKDDFLLLLANIPPDVWQQQPKGRAWTLKEELVHIVQVLEVIPKGIERARAGKKRSWLGLIPTGLRGWVNGRILIPRRARRETQVSIRSAYDEAHCVLVSLIAELTQTDLQKGMPYPRQYRTVEQMVYRPVEHFREHEVHIRQVLVVRQG